MYAQRLSITVMERDQHNQLNQFIIKEESIIKYQYIHLPVNEISLTRKRLILLDIKKAPHVRCQ